MVGLMGLITLHIKFMQGSLSYSNFATLICVSSNNFAIIDLLPTKVLKAGVDSLLNIFFSEKTFHLHLLILFMRGPHIDFMIFAFKPNM